LLSLLFFFLFLFLSVSLMLCLNWGERLCEGMKWREKNVWGCLDLLMMEWICEDDLLKFGSDMIAGRKFKNYFKGVKEVYNFTFVIKNI